jgi:hypothetical protein
MVSDASPGQLAIPNRGRRKHHILCTTFPRAISASQPVRFFGTMHRVYRRSLAVFSPPSLRISRVAVPVMGYGHFVAQAER